jgi:hypothetical protein
VDYRPEPKTLEIARLHINRLRMEDHAYQYVYKNSVFHTKRVALVTIARELHAGGCICHPETKRPMVDQSIVLDEVARSRYASTATAARNTAKDDVDEAVKKDSLFSRLTATQIRSMWPKDDDRFKEIDINRTKTYLYFTDQQWINFGKLTDLFQKINLVISDQADSPDLDDAGSSHVPHVVYFDISARRR